MLVFIRMFVAAMLPALAVSLAHAQDHRYRERYIPTGPNGYVYEAESHWLTPPLLAPGPFFAPAPLSARGPIFVNPYRFGPHTDLPPYGFGNRFYNGYNDPAFPTYGPGVQEFLYFGGADFYGW